MIDVQRFGVVDFNYIEKNECKGKGKKIKFKSRM